MRSTFDSSHSYPDTGLLAVGARVGLLVAFLTIAACAFAPANFIPRVIYSYHLEHFAAFYILGIIGAAAAQRRRLIPLVCWMIGFALLTEIARLLAVAHRGYALLNFVADVGGIVAALTGVSIGHFRTWFARAPE